MVKVALLEEVAFTLRSKARGMDQLKNRRKSALSRWKSSCKGPEVGKSLVGTKNKRRGERRDFPGGPSVKNPPANAGHLSLIPGLGRSHIPQDI